MEHTSGFLNEQAKKNGFVFVDGIRVVFDEDQDKRLLTFIQ